VDRGAATPELRNLFDIERPTEKLTPRQKSFTESEVVGARDYLPYLIRTQKFMAAQGFKLKQNIFYQDNLTAIRLERNGKQS